MSARCGIDVGGTFTDLAYYEQGTNQLHVAKELTTPGNPVRGILSVLDRVDPAVDLEGTQIFVHGTTVALNRLLEGTGARVGLLTTFGFRDVIEIRRAERDNPYDVFWGPPEPLVERALRRPIRERILADGTVETPIDCAGLAAAVEAFRAAAVTAVAVCFLNSYRNPAHEEIAGEFLERHGFAGCVSLSSRLSREYGEFDRTATAIIDAYIRPELSRYLADLEEGLRVRRFGGRAYMMRSGGGVLPFSEARARPFESIFSGPVAGVEGAAAVGEILGEREIITADVGGTSFDTSCILNGRPIRRSTGELAGLPLSAEWVDVRSISAGGGSIIQVDPGGRLRAGPRSAGAVPGPACYGRGGREPTLTDAAAVLGMLGATRFRGGLALDPELAHRAFDPLEDSLGMGAAEIAAGAVRIAAARMADAIRTITVELGRDPGDAALMAYGGAGPLFATALADELNVPRVIVPPFAGNFSAVGLLRTDVVRSSAQTLLMALNEFDRDVVEKILRELFARLRAGSGAVESDTSKREEVRLEFRYRGQKLPLAVDVRWRDGRIEDADSELATRFSELYVRTYGVRLNAPVELVTLRASLRSAIGPQTELLGPANGAVEDGGTITAYSLRADGWRDFRLMAGETLAAGQTATGPAIIDEPTTTVYIDTGWTAVRHLTGALSITRSV